MYSYLFVQSNKTFSYINDKSHLWSTSNHAYQTMYNNNITEET